MTKNCKSKLSPSKNNNTSTWNFIFRGKKPCDHNFFILCCSLYVKERQILFHELDSLFPFSCLPNGDKFNIIMGYNGDNHKVYKLLANYVSLCFGLRNNSSLCSTVSSIVWGCHCLVNVIYWWRHVNVIRCVWISTHGHVPMRNGRSCVFTASCVTVPTYKKTLNLWSNGANSTGKVWALWDKYTFYLNIIGVIASTKSSLLYW